MIIADDCSTDGTRDILKRYEEDDERIHAIFLKENQGAAAARNAALSKAEGRYVAFWTAMMFGKQKSWISSSPS